METEEEAKFLIDRVISATGGDVRRVSLYGDVAPAIAAALRERDARIKQMADEMGEWVERSTHFLRKNEALEALLAKAAGALEQLSDFENVRAMTTNGVVRIAASTRRFAGWCQRRRSILSEQKARCPQCGKWYFVYSYYVGDQSMCGPCRRAAQVEAEENR